MDNCTIPLKHCPKCDSDFPATPEYFYRAKRNRDGLNTYCKECDRHSVNTWYQQNKQRAISTKRTWLNTNRSHHRVLTRIWSQSHPEQHREYARRYHAKHPEKSREKSRIRRARKANVLYTFTVSHERIALDYFNGCCAVCNRQLQDLFGTHTVHWDHWIPLSKGGHTTPDNMVPLCGGMDGCNNRKYSNDPIEWINREFKPRQAKVILARVEAYFEYIKSLAVQE